MNQNPTQPYDTPGVSKTYPPCLWLRAHLLTIGWDKYLIPLDTDLERVLDVLGSLVPTETYVQENAGQYYSPRPNPLTISLTLNVRVDSPPPKEDSDANSE